MSVHCTDIQVSIHAPREGCDLGGWSSQIDISVSIHAPREGCDLRPLAMSCTVNSVSIHAPREGCDHPGLSFETLTEGFQFTHPGRGATATLHGLFRDESSFNSRTPGGVRPPNQAVSSCPGKFQFTHPGRGATSHWSKSIFRPMGFNSRTPGGVRLRAFDLTSRVQRVSIHAPREGCDTIGYGTRLPRTVSIHAPREGCDRG